MISASLLLTLFLQIAVILAVCRLLGLLGTRVGQTQAVSDMVTGIVLGPSLLGLFAPSFQSWLFPQHATVAVGPATAAMTHPSMSILYALSQLGLVLYMFTVGLDFKTDLFRGRLRTVGLVSSVGIVVPFALGAGAAVFLAGRPDFFAAGISVWLSALFLGASMSVTAFPMLARILDEKGISSTRLGTLTLAAGSMDDVVAWCLLAVMLASLHATPSIAVLAIAGGMVYAILMVWIGRPALRILSRWAERDGGVTPSTLLTALVVMMASAGLTDFLGIHSVFGAFLAGTVMPRGRLATGLRQHIEPLTTTLLLPLFFVYSGLNTRIALVNTSTLWMLTAVIILLAVAGKGVACAVAARVAGEGWREAATVGTLMNARGLVELIMLNVGLQAGIIQPTLFTIMVLMAVTTTVMASPLFDYFSRQLTLSQPSGAVAATAAR
ncbi:MAG TPA: cation:proton antiporter [Vicinamibacterales bacterium]|nr:cation:proton antiporter [Vicinamibacterales bacterium]